MKNILFDLDGTLTDPSEGILNCFEYALEKMGGNSIDREELLQCIGPPLRVSFPRLLQTTDRHHVENAIALYRERFATKGMFENHIFAGVGDLLVTLTGRRYNLFVATSKPEVYASKILEYFSVKHFFVAVYGPELDGRFENKRDLVKKLLADHRCETSITCIIGDRKYDVEAGKVNGIKTCGVTYGFGSPAELQEAGCDVICDSVAGLAGVIEKM